MTYTEGWPRKVTWQWPDEVEAVEVVPLSDAERLREERDKLRRMIAADHRAKAAIGGGPCVCEVCAALDREGEG
jgi:NADPH-dependent 2,4-dienoyl-CoA reductase/sulfur reductase-like enzyme